MTSDERLLAAGRDVLQREAAAIAALGARLDARFAEAARALAACRGKAVVVGIGKSGHVGRKLAASLASLGTPAFFLHAAEAPHGDFGMVAAEDVLVLLSHSGETEEVVRLLPVFRQIGCDTISITGGPRCSLAAGVQIALSTGVGEEADPLGLAPTSSAAAALALGDALAVATALLRGFTREDFAFRHPGGSLGKRLGA